MLYLFKPLQYAKVDFDVYKPFIKSDWFRKNYMKFVYALQALFIFMSTVMRVWEYFYWIYNIMVFVIVFVFHELFHIIVVYKIGDISLTVSGIFFWLNSNAVMSKNRFLLFMSLPLIILTLVPLCLLPFINGQIYHILLLIVWINTIIAGSDLINTILILIKPTNTKFYRGYISIKSR